MIVAEQGFGDFIQQWRYLSLVAAEFPTARLECRRELWRLAEAQPSPMPLLPPGASLADPSVERIAMMRLDCFYADPTAGRPYMRIGRPPAAPRSPGRRPRAGLNWAGSPRGIGAAGKSLPLPVLRDLVGAHPGIDWVSIQFGEPEARLDEHAWSAPIERRGRTLRDIYDLGEAIAELDLLITIDSAPAHMAGALGVPTWMLLNSPAGWRWGLGTETTPLYETVRLLRQSKPADWHGVLYTVSARLEGVSGECWGRPAGPTAIGAGKAAGGPRRRHRCRRGSKSAAPRTTTARPSSCLPCRCSPGSAYRRGRTTAPRWPRFSPRSPAATAAFRGALRSSSARAAARRVVKRARAAIMLTTFDMASLPADFALAWAVDARSGSRPGVTILGDPLTATPVRPPDAGLVLWVGSLVPETDLSAFAALAGLSETERTQMSAFYWHRDAIAYAAAHGALRLILGAMLNRSPGALKFGKGPHGKPSLYSPSGTPGEPIHFNISHSKGLAAVGLVAGRRSGIDIEQVMWREDLLDVARLSFAEEQVASIVERFRRSAHQSLLSLLDARRSLHKGDRRRHLPRSGHLCLYPRRPRRA